MGRPIPRAAVAATLAAATLFVLPIGADAAAHGSVKSAAAECLVPTTDGGAAAKGGKGLDHRAMSPAEIDKVELRTQALLGAKRTQGKAAPSGALAAASVPVYVHVMAGKNGQGNVTDKQITDQIAVLNKTFAGRESSAAANTGFTFTLAGTDRFYNDTWHVDGSTNTYRTNTRKGGMNALNMWVLDIDGYGVATFPWDGNDAIDGIRVDYTTLPGGSATGYNLGETATHEAGHWFGLYHTFQGGCTSTNDRVSDTPAQSSSTRGCPEGRDSCSLAGLDPIHNYMDVSRTTALTRHYGVCDLVGPSSGRGRLGGRGCGEDLI